MKTDIYLHIVDCGPDNGKHIASLNSNPELTTTEVIRIFGATKKEALMLANIVGQAINNWQEIGLTPDQMRNKIEELSFGITIDEKAPYELAKTT